MFEEIVKRIKKNQENKNIEILLIQPDIVKFQEDLVKSLQSFITLAKENGVDGIEFHKTEVFDNGVTEYYFQMGFVNYILVTIKSVERLKPENRKFGNYSFIYFDGHETFQPFIKISVFMDTSNKKYFSVVWFSLEDEKLITSNLDLTDSSGEQAAKAVINFLYSGDNFLKDCPTREAFHKSATKKGRIGYPNVEV